jgi:1,4-alpha-glucan branching enzyme
MNPAPGYLSIVLHAHLPFVRHPEHEKFLEESWLYEAITETYLPLIQVMDGWLRDGIKSRLTLALSPTLCAMLRDPLLLERYQRHLRGLIELATKETERLRHDRHFSGIAEHNLERLSTLQATFLGHSVNLPGAFRRFQDHGLLELITTAATHALLPLLANHPESLRAQVLVARDYHEEIFRCAPRGIWLPECAYGEAVDAALREADFRWFILDAHGVTHATPRPRLGIYAPLITPCGIAAFGRDPESAKQVWSRHEGYPGDRRYRDFYRDIGFDLDLDYVRPCLPSPDHRGFTGIKYWRIEEDGQGKLPYNRRHALEAVTQHARHFLDSRLAQVQKLAPLMDRPPLLVAPYDAELFGHWWHEGPDFLDCLVRMADDEQQAIQLITPGDYLRAQPRNQVAAPSPSSWGEAGYYRPWLNATNQWIQPHLHIAQARMTELARKYPRATGRRLRALRQAARELLLAQASDWPFILHTGTSPEYAAKRIKDHLLRFHTLHGQLTDGEVNAAQLESIEAADNAFPNIDYRHWA